jgi:hypothetical protein
MGMGATRTFLSLNLSEWAAVSVIIGVGVSLLVGSGQLRQVRRIRDEQTRPFIIVDFHFRSILASLSVRNVGQTAAEDVRVFLDQPVSSTVMTDVNWQHSGLFADGVPLFAPGREMRFVLDVMSERIESGLPMTFTGRVEYWRPDHGGRQLVERFSLDLTVFANSQLAPKDLSDLADEVERIRRLLEDRK